MQLTRQVRLEQVFTAVDSTGYPGEKADPKGTVRARARVWEHVHQQRKVASSTTRPSRRNSTFPTTVTKASGLENCLDAVLS
jgi:hypothetical protein